MPDTPDYQAFQNAWNAFIADFDQWKDAGWFWNLTRRDQLLGYRTRFNALLEKSKTLGTVTMAPVPVLVSSLINELDELGEPFVLVLDDYHAIHTAAIHDLWAKVLSHPPRALHLVLAVRHDPPLPIDTLRALGRPDEAAILLETRSAPDLAPIRILCRGVELKGEVTITLVEPEPI